MHTIHLYGLGPTVNHAPERPAFSIGVNDAAAHFQFIRHLVIVDKPDVFSAERLRDIRGKTPSGTRVYSNVREWSYTFRDFTPLTFQKARGDCSTLNDPNCVPQSLCSPFVAACVAWSHLRARTVVMHGVDISGHSILSKAQHTIFRHFRALHDAFRKNGGQLYIGHRECPMSEFLPVYHGKDSI